MNGATIPLLQKDNARFSNRLYRNLGNFQFVDVTEKAGVGGKGYGMGVAVGDYNNDGWPDILVASDRTRNLFVHNIKGRFEEIAIPAGLGFSNDGMARAGMGIDAADIDGDGRPDVAISNFESEGIALFMNQGSLSFRDEAGPRGLLEPSFRLVGFGLRFCDYDNDGTPDLIMTSGHVLDDIDRYRHDMTWAQPLLLLHNTQGKLSVAPILDRESDLLSLLDVDWQSAT